MYYPKFKQSFYERTQATTKNTDILCSITVISQEY